MTNSDLEKFQMARDVVYSRDEEKYGGAQEILLELARKGHKEAAPVFGLLAILSGIPSEIEIGLNILQSGFDANDKAAICNLGVIYKEGLNVEVNFEKALEYFTKAAELGSGSAWLHYGMMVLHGEGVTINLDTAAMCFQNAEKRGSKSAKEILPAVQNAIRSQIAAKALNGEDYESYLINGALAQTFFENIISSNWKDEEIFKGIMTSSMGMGVSVTAATDVQKILVYMRNLAFCSGISFDNVRHAFIGDGLDKLQIQIRALS